MTNSDPNLLARVQVSFFKAYKSLRFDGEDRKHFLQNHGLDEMIRVPLTLESPDIEVPYNIQVCLDKCFETNRPTEFDIGSQTLAKKQTLEQATQIVKE